MTADEARLSPLRVFDAVKALAFIGDLSMGQPTDHSPRTAWLAARLAHAAQLDAAACDTVRETSLLRWSGCTANAGGFAELFGDDVQVRGAMLENRSGWAKPLEGRGDVGALLAPLAQIHCEVSGEVARMLGLARETERALRHIFESWDGHGVPAQLAGEAVPFAVFVVGLAGDLEALGRAHGVAAALALVAQRSETRYPARLVAIAAQHAHEWIAELDRATPGELDAALATPAMQQTTSAELIADVIDLKLPWMTGFSRAVAATAAQCCARLTADPAAPLRVYRAGLIHGIGRAAVPNGIWNATTRLPESAWEKVRLVPYWTARAGKQAGALNEAAELASQAYERLDGSGYFRGAREAALTLEARVLAATVAWVALRSARPWRAALCAEEAARQLHDDVAAGRLSGEVVDALLADSGVTAPRPAGGGTPGARASAQGSSQASAPLSAREIDVLRAISRGASNKEAARALTLSPSTVRTHVESVFRKLECSTRAAATLKAAALGLL
ncbi:HD domain-containing phosphohydrolase [Paraburkholderia acidisoli]|uniref:LuxR family transcriptional regulator n=1 Tax=Paraburkholderia acidisoli TaxID=2571748 RepID=A0A7Z2GR42_9BURK|nr:HD domain-containing phosphohydrolase [Paraburkholderia acidisoli]QGZ66004.1 LuxR family transcriptional regulator [Paraburkholderia acidisoli]